MCVLFYFLFNTGFCCLRESDITKERVQKILASGANVILTTGGVDDMCLKYFVDVGAIAVRRVLKRDLKRIAKATGGMLMFVAAEFSMFFLCAHGGMESLEKTSLCLLISSNRLPLFNKSGGRGDVRGHHARSGRGGCAGTHLRR